MTVPEIPRGRFNQWRHKRALACDDKEMLSRAQNHILRRDLAPCDTSALFLRELKNCDGLEFVAFSNLHLPRYVHLPYGVTLVPCYLTCLSGANASDPIVRRTIEMGSLNRYVYDGWIPISDWTDKGVHDATRRVSEALALFCLHHHVSFQWEEKYKVQGGKASGLEYPAEEVSQLELVAEAIDGVGPAERSAILKSVGWLSQSVSAPSPEARLLFAILAIESLALFVERQSSAGSGLSAVRAETLDKSQRRARRRQCIDETLKELMPQSPERAIQSSYFDCIVGLKATLRTHLDHVLGKGDADVSRLLESDGGKTSLYELRHTVAHGTANVLNESDRHQLYGSAKEAQKIAQKYLWVVLRKVFRKEELLRDFIAMARIPMFGIASDESMYIGPTHMALLYR